MAKHRLVGFQNPEKGDRIPHSSSKPERVTASIQQPQQQQDHLAHTTTTSRRNHQIYAVPSTVPRSLATGSRLPRPSSQQSTAKPVPRLHKSALSPRISIPCKSGRVSRRIQQQKNRRQREILVRRREQPFIANKRLVKFILHKQKIYKNNKLQRETVLTKNHPI